MPARPRAIDLASERARASRFELGRELRHARHDRDLSLADIAAAIRISQPQTSRIERGLAPSVSVEQLARMAAAVGLDLRIRLYPGAGPIRDAAHAELLERLRHELHPSLRLLTEVPLPIPGDQRAWDGMIRGSRWSLPVEAETRPRDLQGLDRRLNLKLRDSGLRGLILLLLDSRHNRRLIREHRATLANSFPIPGSRALELLRTGVEPGGSAIILL